MEAETRAGAVAPGDGADDAAVRGIDHDLISAFRENSDVPPLFIPDCRRLVRKIRVGPDAGHSLQRRENILRRVVEGSPDLPVHGSQIQRLRPGLIEAGSADVTVPAVRYPPLCDAPVQRIPADLDAVLYASSGIDRRQVPEFSACQRDRGSGFRLCLRCRKGRGDRQFRPVDFPVRQTDRQKFQRNTAHVRLIKVRRLLILRKTGETAVCPDAVLRGQGCRPQKSALRPVIGAHVLSGPGDIPFFCLQKSAGNGLQRVVLLVRHHDPVLIRDRRFVEEDLPVHIYKVVVGTGACLLLRTQADRSCFISKDIEGLIPVFKHLEARQHAVFLQVGHFADTVSADIGLLHRDAFGLVALEAGPVLRIQKLNHVGQRQSEDQT